MRTSNRRHFMVLALLSVPVLGMDDEGCRVDQPTVQVWPAAATTPSDCNLKEIDDHQGIRVSHQLPGDVTTELPVEITVDTPCTSATTTMRHDENGLAGTTVEAPAGSSCGITVTVRVANDVRVCRRDTAGDCESLETVCEEEDEADESTDAATD